MGREPLATKLKVVPKQLFMGREPLATKRKGIPMQLLIAKFNMGSARLHCILVGEFRILWKTALIQVSMYVYTLNNLTNTVKYIVNEDI